MITKNDDLLGTLIHDVAHLLRLDIDRRLSSHNLTRVKWLALGIIHENGPMTQAELAAQLELGHASVGRLVDRLEERGFVTRRADPNDRRSYLLSETRSAKTLLKELSGMSTELREEALKNVAPSDIKTLSKSLKKVKANLKTAATTLPALAACLVISSQKFSEGSEYLLSSGIPL